jgi:hypothetical protein
MPLHQRPEADFSRLRHCDIVTPLSSAFPTPCHSPVKTFKYHQSQSWQCDSGMPVQTLCARLNPVFQTKQGVQNRPRLQSLPFPYLKVISQRLGGTLSPGHLAFHGESASSIDVSCNYGSRACLSSPFSNSCLLSVSSSPAASLPGIPNFIRRHCLDCFP